MYILHTHTRSRMHIHKYTLHMPPPIHAHTQTHKCTHAHTCKCTHSLMCTHMYTQRHAQEHMCMHSHMHVHVCTERHIHEHTCAHAHTLLSRAAPECCPLLRCPRAVQVLLKPLHSLVFQENTWSQDHRPLSRQPSAPTSCPSQSPERTPHTGGLPIADMDFSVLWAGHLRSLCGEMEAGTPPGS